jgi:UDP-N-acetylmuramyl pentapeptide phosphotransferase/UDP-N-acetylglucosamine-1-phosphate transferase
VLDDLTPVSPVKKFLGQLMVAVILAYKADVQITSFYGVLGVNELPVMVRFALSVTIIIGIINAFNLIDGINGLAGGIGLLACLAFGIWFFSVGMISLAVSAIALSGSIIAFLKYNLAPCRIFMGDTGSLLIGTMCSILAIEFVEANYQMAPSSPFRLASAPSIALAILILPVFDTCSVFARRMMRGNSPFTADKTHIHHQMLAITGSHARATVSLLLFNILFVAFAFSIRNLGTQQSMPILVAVVSVCGFILYKMYSAKKGFKR